MLILLNFFISHSYYILPVISRNYKLYKANQMPVEAPFKKALIEHSKEFITTSSYRTITRKNGSEIITVSDGKIKVTSLTANSKEGCSTSELVGDLPFEPSEILMNQSEELLCLYDESNIWAISLNKEGSNINFTTVYKLGLELNKGERVLQVIFNNRSKFQAELVVLSTNEISTYNINRSLNEPVQRYDFKEEYKNNSKAGCFDYDCSIVDAVSICFASSCSNSPFSTDSTNSPQNDLTLLLLSSDASVYKIHPFFPYELSVSKEWLTDLFDYSTLLFESADSELKQAALLSSVKISAKLCEAVNPKSIIIKDELPPAYRKGKITGPLSFDCFSEELYAFNATKLLALPNDVLVVVFDHAVVVVSRSSTSGMIFEGQQTEPNDSLLQLDSFIFDADRAPVCTVALHPTTGDSIFITFANGVLLQVDFKQWMAALATGLETGDLTEFTEMCYGEKLPTEVLNLGRMNLPKEKSADCEVPLRSHENNIWFAWNTRNVFSVCTNADNKDALSITVTDTIHDKEQDEQQELEFGLGTKEEDQAATGYTSLLVGEYGKEVLPQLKLSLSKIAEINDAMIKFPTTVLNETKTTAEDLKKVHTLTELVSSGQLLLFKVLSILSERLEMLSREYHHQISTYHTVILKKERILENFFKLKAAFNQARERQDLLIAKLGKVVTDTELLEARGGMTGLGLSCQEAAYFKELARMRDYVVRKEAELKELQELLENVSNAEMGILRKNKEELCRDFRHQKSLEGLKQSLESQTVFIQHLVDRFAEVSLK